MTEMNSNREAQVVTDPVVAKLLTHPAHRRALDPFLRGPCSVAQAAQHIGWTPDQMYYQVAKLTSLGLLESAGAVKTGRHVTQLHQATARAFIIPFTLTPHATFKELLSALDLVERFTAHAAAALVDTGDQWGVMVFAPPEGPVTTTLTPLEKARPLTVQDVLGPDYPALWRSDELLTLTPVQSKELQRELAALLARYRDSASTEQKATHFLMLGLTPTHS